MPLIAIAGPICSGKHTIADWLVQREGFRRVVIQRAIDRDPRSSQTTCSSTSLQHFRSTEELLDYATRNWRQDLVTTDVFSPENYDVLSKRPFFLLVSVDAPLMTRFERYRERCERLEEDIPDLASFVSMTDMLFYGGSNIQGTAAVFHRASLRILNTQKDLSSFHRQLETLDITNPDRIRPSWDAYFMQLASLASLRSNCMKRRVGCVLVRNKRVISTGYNGTPRGLTNCNEGGCGRCNSAQAGGVGLGTCLCLHAEENALLESGRDRVGDEATLYCNTCPCLTCSVKIAQVGVKEVIYNQAYSMDEKSAEILREAGVILRQFSPPYED